MGLQHVQEFFQQVSQIHGPEIHAQIPADDVVQVGVELGVVDWVFWGSESEEGVFQGVDVVLQDRHDRVFQDVFHPFGQAAGHAEVQPGDFSVFDPQVARMGVGMEKSVFQDLFAVVLCRLLSDLGVVVAQRPEFFQTVDLQTADVAHGQDLGCGVFPVDFGACYVDDVFLVFREEFQVCGFFLEIHFFLGGLPHFFYDRAEVHDIFGLHRQVHHSGGFPHQGDVFCHDLMDVGALDFDDGFFSALQTSSVYLGDGR